jgi:DNA-binding MarR family transcriptional regulator
VTGETTGVDEVLELVSLLQRDQARWFERDGLSESRAHLLWVLQHGPVTQRSLADTMGVTPRNVTGLVDGLAATGHVERRPHPTDRRATLVTLTPHGLRAVAAMIEGYGELTEVLFGGFTAEDVRSFRSAMRTMLARLRTRLAEEPP